MLPAQIVVTSSSGAAADAGAGSQVLSQETLADAIAYIDATDDAGATITFASGVTGINLIAALPDVTVPLTIDGGGTATISGDGEFEALYVAKGTPGTTKLVGLTIEDSGASAVHAYAPIEIDDSRFLDNTGADGGAVYAVAPTTISDSSFRGNFAEDGSAVWIIDGNLTVSGSTFSVNGNSGAVTGSHFGTIDLVNGTDATISDSTITGNASSSAGAGIYMGSAGSIGHLTITASTITGNTVAGVGQQGAGLLVTGADAVTLQDTVIAGNTADSDPDVQISQSNLVPSASFTLIGNGGGSGLTSGNTNIVGTASQPVNPKLGPLADNGGPTATMLPQPGSPLVDGGNAFGLTTDQRGDPRTVDLLGLTFPNGGDGTDIGAVEVQPGAWLSPQVKRDGNQRITLTTPNAAVCQRTGTLPVTFSSLAGAAGTPQLTFAKVAFTLDRGVRRVVTVKGRQKVEFLPNLTTTRRSARLSLKLFGLADGAHRLRVTVTYTRKVKRRLRSTSTTLQAGFRVC